MSNAINEIKCPTCGEIIKFDPETGMNRCEACGNYYFIDMNGSDESVVKESNKSHCPNCGGDLRFEIGTDEISCNSCGSNFKIAKPESEENCHVGFEPDFIIPFSVTENQLKQKFIDELATSDYVPTDIFDKVGFDYIKGYYQPYYRLDASFDADYTASVGFDRKEQYEDYETVYENGRTYKKRVLKERTVTDWHPISGHTSGHMVLWSSGIKNSKDNIAYSSELKKEQIKNQDLTRAYDEIVKRTNNIGKEFDKRYLAGFLATPFSKDQTGAWNDSKEDRNNIIENDVSNQISGDHVKDISWSSTSTLNYVDTYYVPIWVVAYCYCGTNHTFIASGSDISLNYLSKPKDISSVKKAKLFYLPLKILGGIIVAYFILFLLFVFDGEYETYDAMGMGFPWLLGLGLITLGIGYFGKKICFQKKRQ